MKILDVLLHDRLIGTLVNLDDDTNVFTFDPAYREDPSAPTLSWRAMRDPATGRYRARVRPTMRKATPYFSNLLPENELRTYIAQHAGVSDRRDFPLLWLLGEDLPGAVIVRDPGAQTPPPEVGESVDEEAAPLRFSLAGVQMKFSVAGDPNSRRGLTVPVSGIHGTGIAKLPDRRFSGVPENEFAMMTLAREVGIDVPRIALVDVDSIGNLPHGVMREGSGAQAYYIERFDRMPDGSRIHTEDFAQANELYATDKYKKFNFDLLAQQIAIATGTEGGLEFFRRLTFTLLIGNGDMHAKNWSVIYRDQRTPSLAPAYDYVATIVFMGLDDDLGMNLMGTKLFTEIAEGRLAALADRARLPMKAVLRVVRETVERTLDVMRTKAPELLPERDLALIREHQARLPLVRPTVRNRLVRGVRKALVAEASEHPGPVDEREVEAS